MKNYEVGIIVGAIALIGYFWWTNSDGTPSQEPIASGVAKVISVTSGPFKLPPECITPGGTKIQETQMIVCHQCLVETP